MRTLGAMIIGLLVAIFLTVTNPTMEDFHQHLQAELKAGSSEEKPDLFSTAVGTVSTWVTTEYGKQTAARKDYLVFSLYTAKVGNTNRAWVGIAKRFFAL